MTINEWAAELRSAPRRSPITEDFWAICPCHSDIKPSLHVFISASGGISMKCFACGADGVTVCRKMRVETEELRGYPMRGGTLDEDKLNCLNCRYCKRHDQEPGEFGMYDCGKYARYFSLTYKEAKKAYCSGYVPDGGKTNGELCVKHTHAFAPRNVLSHSILDTSVDWKRALNVATCAVCDKLDELTGNRQTASDELIHALVDCFADRVASMVSKKINRELEESTPQVERNE